jgi:pimeloyl-ACP methyl ester carboxylesterase
MRGGDDQTGEAPGGRSSLAQTRPGSGKHVALVLAMAAAAGMAVAATNHRLARRAEARHPPRGRFITIGGVRLHYLDEGVGAPIVLVHGNGVTSEDFLTSGLFASLAAAHRVIAFDRPGFGYSDRPRTTVWTATAQARLLLQAIERIGATRPVLVGHSWGTTVAANMALEAPEAVSGLVLMSGYYRPTVRPDAALLAGPAMPLVGDLMRFTLSPLMARLMAPQILKTLFAPAPVSERFRSEYPISLSFRPSQLRASAAESGLMRREAARLTARLPALAVPTLIVGGEDDRLIDFAHQSKWLASRLAAAELLPIKGAGHMVHHTAPDEVAAAIEAFATRCYTQQAGPLGRARKGITSSA